jgi:hypothetical protein
MLLVTGVALVSIEFISVPFTRVLMYCHTILLSRGGLSADCRALLLGGGWPLRARTAVICPLWWVVDV